MTLPFNHRTRVALLLGAAISTNVAVSAHAQWTVTNLQPAGSFFSYANAISGMQQVGFAEVGGTFHASLWNGTATSWIDLHPVGSVDSSEILGTSGGQQSGYATVNGLHHASLWSGTAASWIDLHPAGAVVSEAFAAHNGIQVGFTSMGGADHASLWRGSAASWVDLNPPGITAAIATSADGEQQAGRAFVGGASHASLWSGSAASWVDLHPAGLTSSEANGISGPQQAGRAEVNGQFHACVWSGSATLWVDLNPAGAVWSEAYAISGGQQVGIVYAGGLRASLWSGSAASWVDLSEFLPAGLTSSFATGISSDAAHTYVSGHAFNPQTGRTQAVLWTGPAPAPIECERWVQQAPSTSPSARLLHAMAYDPVHNVVLLYGGIFDGQARADFWQYDGSTWTQISADALPGRRRSAMMAWDAESQQIVLFGGYDDNTGSYRRDNWGWDGSQWTAIHTSPSAREGGALAQGPDLPDGRHTLVLYGGGDCCGYFNETWIWDGIDWTQANPPSTAGQRINFFMAYDPVRRKTVLFGGNINGAGVSSGTYEWDGTTWTLRATTGPSARAGAVMWFDPRRSRVMLFGGHNSNASPSNFNDTWEWDANQWIPVPVSGPVARDATAMAFNRQSGQAVLFGGAPVGSPGLQDTWTFSDFGTNPSLTLQPTSAQTCRIGPASFMVAVTAPATVTYQWRRNGINLINSPGFIEGAQTATLSLLYRPDAGTYDCIVTNSCGGTTSNPATLTICSGDFSCNGIVNSQDFFEFLGHFFNNGGDPAADFDYDGAVTSQDFFDFLAAFFAGC